MSGLVKQLNQNDLAQYNLPVFAMEFYLSSISTNFGWLGNEDFLISYYIKRKWGVKILIFTSAPFKITKFPKKSESEFIEKCLKIIIKQLKVDYIQRPPTNVFFNSFPNNSQKMPFGSYVINLDSSEEEIFSKFHSKHRNVIRKSIKDGLEVKKSNSFDNKVCNLINETLFRQNLPKLKFDYIKNIDQSHVLFSSIYKNGEIQGAAIFFWSIYGAYYMYGGSIERPHTGAMNLLHWECIKFFKLKGVKKYDFVGARDIVNEDSKIKGIQRFKERFGGEKKMGFLWKKKLSLKGHIYEFLIRVKNLSLKIDIIDEYEKKDFFNF